MTVGQSLVPLPMTYDVVFCESIRQEANGKTFILGIYADDLIAPVFPFFMPEFFVQVKLAVHVDSDEVPKRVRIVANGLITDGAEIDFDDASKNFPIRNGFVLIDVTRQYQALNIPAPTMVDVFLGTNRGERKIRSLNVTSAQVYQAEFLDKEIFAPALAFYAAYLDRFLSKTSEWDGSGNVDNAAFEVFKTLFDGRSNFTLNDSSQPAWLRVDSKRLWILNTQPWHNRARIELTRNSVPVKYTELRHNAVGRLLELDPSEGLTDTQTLKAVATEAVNA